MSEKTLNQYNRQVERCREVFIEKFRDYGPSWSVYRISSLIDQIFIKADRIRNIEMGKIPMVNENSETEFIGIVNYCVITLIQLRLKLYESNPIPDMNGILQLYDEYIEHARQLMLKKNHDYGEAWRNMYISSFTDIILARINRIKSILDRGGKTLVSEGIEPNLYDMINYAFFALIKLNENQ